MQWLYNIISMELTKYDKKRLTKRISPMTKWLINVNLNTGAFYLNDLIRANLDLKAGMSVLVAKDEKSGKWYISFDEGLHGFRLHGLRNNKGHFPRLMFGSKEPAHRLLSEVKATVGATFIISQNPTKIDGHTWYRIITNTPARVN